MGILDRYTSDEDKEELAKNLKLPIKSPKVSTEPISKNAPISKDKKTAKTKNPVHSETDDELLSVINDFMATYKGK